MNKNLPSWKEKGVFEKSLSIIGCAISLAIIILAVLQITGIYEKVINIIEPLLGFLMLIQAMQFRKYNKKLAILSMCVAIFIFIITLIVFFFDNTWIPSIR